MCDEKNPRILVNTSNGQTELVVREEDLELLRDLIDMKIKYKKQRIVEDNLTIFATPKPEPKSCNNCTHKRPDSDTCIPKGHRMYCPACAAPTECDIWKKIDKKLTFEDIRKMPTSHFMGKDGMVADQRKRFRRAYEPWTREEDALLRETFQNGVTDFNTLANKFQRNVGGIESRLTKLRLIFPDRKHFGH